MTDAIPDLQALFRSPLVVISTVTLVTVMLATTYAADCRKARATDQRIDRLETKTERLEETIREINSRLYRIESSQRLIMHEMGIDPGKKE